MACGLNLGCGLFLYSLHGKNGFYIFKGYKKETNESILPRLDVAPKA